MAKKNKNKYRYPIKKGINDKGTWEYATDGSDDSIKLDNKYSNVDNVLAEPESLYINGDFDREGSKEKEEDKMNIKSFFDQVFGEENVRKYSGRGMYGRECLGVDTNLDVGQFFAEVLAGIEVCYDAKKQGSALEELSDVFTNMKTDSMGLGKIVYFPNLQWDKDWSESHSDEEDE